VQVLLSPKYVPPCEEQFELVVIEQTKALLQHAPLPLGWLVQICGVHVVPLPL